MFKKICHFPSREMFFPLTDALLHLKPLQKQSRMIHSFLIERLKSGENSCVFHITIYIAQKKEMNLESRMILETNFGGSCNSDPLFHTNQHYKFIEGHETVTQKKKADVGNANISSSPHASPSTIFKLSSSNKLFYSLFISPLWFHASTLLLYPDGDAIFSELVLLTMQWLDIMTDLRVRHESEFSKRCLEEENRKICYLKVLKGKFWCLFWWLWPLWRCS